MKLMTTRDKIKLEMRRPKGSGSGKKILLARQSSHKIVHCSLIWGLQKVKLCLFVLSLCGVFSKKPQSSVQETQILNTGNKILC